MDARRFTALLEAYGADPERWPTTERSAALAYSRRSAEAAAALERAANLDMLLEKGARKIAVPDELTTRVQALAPLNIPAETPAENTAENVIPIWRRILPRDRTGWQRIAATAVIGITAGMLFSEILQDRADGTSTDIAAVMSPVPETSVIYTEEFLVLENAAVQTAPPQSDLATLSFTGFEAPTVTPLPVSPDDGAGSLANLDLL